MGKVGKIIGIIVAIVAIGVIGFFGFRTIKGLIDSQPPTTQTLAIPNKLAFDKENHLLTWESVENASGYTIVYNGTNIEIGKDKTSHLVLINSTENTFKIKANGDGVNYKDSNWSDTITYNITTPTLYEKITIELNRAMKAEEYTLDRVVGISFIDENEYWMDINARFEVVAIKDNVKYNLGIAYRINDKNNIEEILNSISEINHMANVDKNLVSYNSAQKLIERERYDGEMEELRTLGYEISIVDSCVREGYKVGGKFRFEIVGTYKATLGNDVKYFTSVNQINVLDSSSDDRYYYEAAVFLEDRSTVTETRFVMHEAGGTLEYMKYIVD